MSEIQEAEAMFNRFSSAKQERVLLDLFRKIDDKDYVYGTALVIYQREERERKAGKRGGRIVKADFERKELTE